MGKQWKQWQTLFFWAPKSLQMVIAAMKLKTLAPWKKSYDQTWQHIKKQRHYFANKGPFSQGYGFSSSHVWMWELDCKEGWSLKNWCFWTLVLEKGMSSHSSILAWRIHGQRSLVGYSTWGHKELDTTEWLTLSQNKERSGAQQQLCLILASETTEL